MNCLEAQALLSAAHDGELIAPDELDAARAHCAACPECTAFADGLRYLDTLPVPPAPKDMTKRIMAAVAPLAAERAEILAAQTEEAEVEAIATELPEPDDAPEAEPETTRAPESNPASAGRFTWFAGPVRWASYGAAAALAASALIAFVVIGMNGTPAATQSTGSAGAGSTSLDFTYGSSTAAPQTDAGSNAAKVAEAIPAPAQAPDYVLYNGFIYAPGALLADASSATPTIGTLSTAFASGGSVAKVTVFRSPLTDGSIVVDSPDGMRLYSPVTRMLRSVRYQLTSAKNIDRFGVWPTLPGRFVTPTNSTGTPTFVQAGTDALSVTVFSAIGQPVTAGFAVAPGTAGTDPAGGNPGWTWWLPAPATP